MRRCLKIFKLKPEVNVMYFLAESRQLLRKNYLEMNIYSETEMKLYIYQR